jgi:hypothetical protein
MEVHSVPTFTRQHESTKDSIFRLVYRVLLEFVFGREYPRQTEIVLYVTEMMVT